MLQPKGTFIWFVSKPFFDIKYKFLSPNGKLIFDKSEIISVYQQITFSPSGKLSKWLNEYAPIKISVLLGICCQKL